MNNESSCLVCFKGPEHWENGNEIALIKHHVKYFPEVIAFVHFKCHQKIHDPDKPLTQFIQYTREDSIKYYKIKEEKQNEQDKQSALSKKKYEKKMRKHREKNPKSWRVEA